MAHFQQANTQNLKLVRTTPRASEAGELKGKRAMTMHRLMNACAAIIVRTGFRSVSMTAIAEEAGITRQNVYRYFANADEAVKATVRRAGDEVMAAQCEIYSEEGEPRDLIVTAVMTSLRLITMNVLLVKAISSDGNPRALYSSGIDEATTARSVEKLRQIGDRVGWDDAECAEVHEILVRCINSFLMMPVKDQGEAAIRDKLYRRLIPALGL